MRVLKILSAVVIAVVMALLLVVGILLYPYSTTVVPAWSVRIVDENGKPYPKIKATQVWKHNTLDSLEHSDTRFTDQNGYVSFPERRITANALRRILLTLAELLPFSGEKGLLGYIYTEGPDDGFAVIHYVPGVPQPKKLILRSDEPEMK